MESTSTHPRADATLRLIGAFKLAKALLFVALGAALVGLFGHEARIHELIAWVAQLRPGVLTRLVDRLLRGALSLPIGTRFVLEAGAFVYAALFATEGVGLLRGARWAEWLTVVSTALLIPFECYELAHHVTAVRVLLLVGNVAILVYLIARLRRERSR